jgi:ferrochelatase
MELDKKLAVVLFNLGGPLTRADIRPFLFNLFSDRQIIRLPFFLRLPLAWYIAKKREALAQENYKLMKGFNGGSPLLENTKAQAGALEQELKKTYGAAKVFIAMRYFHPFARETLEEIKNYRPDKVVLLPLYPHYSTTTTESSLREWKKLAPAEFASSPICCWWNEAGFIQAHRTLLKEAMAKVKDASFHILFSAHGVPESIIKRGDPYQNQIEASAQLIADAVGLLPHQWSIAYQSRVGRLKWLGPETGVEIKRLTGAGKTTLFIVPLSFVSEHIETLVELDIEFKQLADAAGLKHYIRVPTLSVQPEFIKALVALITRSLSSEGLLCPDDEPCTQTYGKEEKV